MFSASKSMGKTRRSRSGHIGSLVVVSMALLALTLAAARPTHALDVKVAPGYSLSTIATNLRAPRGVVQTSADTAWILEFGGWPKNTGSLVKLTRSGSTWKNQRVLTKLDRPVGLVSGPDGKLYVGEVTRISRFDPSSATPKLERVITDLPGKGLHPLTVMAFTPTKELIVNVGSDTNNCEKQKGRRACSSAEGSRPLASLRRYRFNWTTGKVVGFDTIARGLRNSMGLAVHPSGLIMQAENSRDAIDAADPKLDDETLPHDELNVIQSGKHYGWPYCFDNQRNAPEWRSYACATTESPHVLLPAHSAPLGLTYWGDQLVVSYHGYRDTGHRLMGFPVDASGRVTGEGRELIGNWIEVDEQQLGGPVGTSVGADGALWITDDRNNVVVRLAKT